MALKFTDAQWHKLHVDGAKAFIEKCRKFPGPIPPERVIAQIQGLMGALEMEYEGRIKAEGYYPAAAKFTPQLAEECLAWRERDTDPSVDRPTPTVPTEDVAELLKRHKGITEPRVCKTCGNTITGYWPCLKEECLDKAGRSERD